MNFDPTKAPHIADDNWLAEAIVAKLGKETCSTLGQLHMYSKVHGAVLMTLHFAI